MGEEKICSNCGDKVRDHSNDQLLACIKEIQDATMNKNGSK